MVAGYATAVVLYLSIFVPLCGVFQKAGKPAWLGLIPFANFVVLLQVVNRPTWWIVPFLIPIVGFVIWIVVSIDLSRAFGKSDDFAWGLILLAFVFLFVLWLGKAEYGLTRGAGARSAE